MSGRTVRYELLLFATIGFEGVYLSLLAHALGQGRAGTGVGWLPFFLAGAAMLGWNRLLIWYGRWEEGGGHLLSFAGALPLIALLLGMAVPGPVAGGGAWAEAFSGIPWLLFEPRPLTVLLLVGLLLWFRSVLIAQSESTLESTTSRFRWSLLFIIFLVIDAATRGRVLPAWGIFLFFGWGLIAFALARAHMTIQQSEEGLLVLPFNRRWLATLVGGVGTTVGLAMLASLVFSLQNFYLLRLLLFPFRLLFSLIWVVLAFLVSWLLGPLAASVLENSQQIEWPELSPPAPIAQEEELPPPDLGALQTILDIVLYLGLALFIGIVLWYLYRLLRHQARARDTIVPLEGAYVMGEAEWGSSDWLQRIRDALRRRPRRSFGVDTVRDLYKNLLQFGDEHGLPRPAEDTPYDYLRPLTARYPQRHDDFHALTDAYVAAHYGEQLFPADEVARLQAAWQRIARAAPPDIPGEEGPAP